MLKHEFRSSPDPAAMPIALSLNAISFLNQVSRTEAQRIERALERLSFNYEALSQTHVNRLAAASDKDGHPLSSYRVSRDVRVFLFVDRQTINVVDIIRKSQIDSLKSLPGAVV